MSYKGFRWENDIWWWEMIRCDEWGLPARLNFVVPDKLAHFLCVFGLCWLFSNWLNRHWALAISWSLMMIPWEIVWDGMFRGGASWRDMVANTLGGLLCWWWLGSEKIGQLPNV